MLDTLSKSPALASVLALAGLLVAAHPDITWLIRALASAAFVAGWLGGHLRGALAAWVAALILAPAPLRLIAGREGPVLDLVWMAGLAGTLARSGHWSSWRLPVLWRVPIGGWALTLALAWPVLAAREARFDPRNLFDTATVSSWAGYSAAGTIGWMLSAVLAQLVGLLWLDTVAAQCTGGRSGRLPAPVHGFWLAATAAGIVALLQTLFDPGLLSSTFWAAQGRATGTMLDANAYGVAAALAGPVGWLALREIRMPGGPALGAFVLALNWSGMWASGSRTALLVAAAGAAGVWLEVRRTRHAGARTVLALTAGAAVLLVAIAAGTSGPLRRMFDLPEGPHRAGLDGWRAAVAEIWRRGGYGTIAHQIVREFPTGGLGVGTFHVIAPDYGRTLFDLELPFDNAQNWWRHIVAEMGVVGGLPALAWSVLVAWQVLRPRAHRRGAAAAGAPATPDPGVPTVRGLLVGLGLCSLIGMPTQNAAVALGAFGLVAWYGSATAAPPVHARTLRAGWITVAATAVTYAGLHLVQASGALSVEARAKRAQRPFVEGAYGLEYAGNRGFQWTGPEARFVLPRPGDWMVIQLWAHHPDIEARPVEVGVSTPCQAVLETALHSWEPIVVGLRLPEGQDAVELRVTVSRTWRPSEYGEPDGRALGAAVAWEAVSEEFGSSRERVVALEPCPRLAR